MAGTIRLSTLLVPVEGDTKGLQSAMGDAEKSTTSFASRLTSLGVTALKGLTVAAVAATTATIGLGVGIAKLAIDAAPLEGLKKSFDAITTSTDKLTPQLKALKEYMSFTDIEGDWLNDFLVDMQQSTNTAARELGKALEGVGSTTVNALQDYFTAAGKSGDVMVDELKNVPTELQSLAKEVAGTLDGLAGSSEDMMARLKEASGGMVTNRDLMMSFNKAAQLVSKDFAEQLPDAMEKLRKVAFATGEDMDFMLNSLVTGIGRLSPMILDNLQIQVSLTDATSRASEMFGVEADQLSKAQQQAGMMSVVLEKLEENTASLPDIVGTAAGEWGAFTTRLKDFKDELGMGALPFLSQLSGLLNKLADVVLPAASKAFTTVLLPAMQAIISGLSTLGAKAWAAAQDFSNKFGGKIAEVASKALNWGVNIATQLAQGIINGAATAITAAMQFINGMLTSWLAPGSPPRVAPDLDKWGLAAMGEWLKGWAQGDFDALEALQTPLEQALNALVSMGDISEHQAGGRFRAVSTDLASALESLKTTGKVTEGIFEELTEVGGVFGKQLASLAESQFKLADATNTSADAQERLNSIQNEQLDAQRDVDIAIAEYNEALAKGADPSILSARRKEFEMAQARLRLLEDEKRAAQDLLSSSTVDIEGLKDEVALRATLLDQMIKLAPEARKKEKAGGDTGVAVGGAMDEVGQANSPEEQLAALKKLKDAMGVGAEGGAGGGVGDTGGGAGAGLVIPSMTAGGNIGDIFGGGDGIGQKLADMFEPLRKLFMDDLPGIFAPVGEEWATMIGNFNVLGGIEGLAPILDTIGTAAGGLATFVWTLGSALINSGIQTELNWIKENGPDVKTSFEDIGASIGVLVGFLPDEGMVENFDKWTKGFEFLNNLGLDTLADNLEVISLVMADLARAGENLSGALEILLPQLPGLNINMDGLSKVFDAVKDSMVNLLPLLLGPAGIPTLFLKFLEDLGGVAEALEGTKIGDALAEILTGFSGSKSEIETTTDDTTGAVRDSWSDLKRDLVDQSIVPDMLGGILLAWQGH